MGKDSTMDASELLVLFGPRDKSIQVSFQEIFGFASLNIFSIQVSDFCQCLW